MKERKRRPDLLKKLGMVSLALLVTFSSVDHSVFAEDEENEVEETQEITEQTISEETADPEEAIEAEVTETAEPEEPARDEKEPSEAVEAASPDEVSPEPVITPEEHTDAEEMELPMEENELENTDPIEEIQEETVEETEEVDESPLFVYEAKDAADMASAVASLSDDDSRRLVANTEDDLSEILDVEGTAVYYEGSYIISLEDAGNVDDAMVTISSLTDASPVRDERMELCADDLLIQAVHYTENQRIQHLQNISETGSYIALIDTGVNGYNVDSINLTSDPDGDNNGHGTMMAETIMNASDGRAKILSIKAFNDDGTASLSNIYAAVRYAIEADVDIINISAAMPDSENTRAVKEILTEATDKGITVVVAAGNRGTDASGYFPANMGNVITVGAATNKGQVVINSNFGTCVDYYVTALSTSFAAARMTGYLVTGNIDREDVFQWIMPETEIRPEEYMDINSEEYKRMKIAGCWDAEGCYLTSERDWWLADLGVYLTKIQASDGTFMCHERGHAFVASRYHYAGPASSDDGILAAWGYATGYGPGTNFERAQRAIWGQDREAALADAYAWAASMAGGTAVHAQPSFDSNSKTYIPGQEVVFRGNSDVSEYGYYVTNVSVSGGDDIKTSDVSARISGNNLYVTVSEQANEMPETVTITVDTDLPDEPGSFTCDSAYFTSEVDSQGMLYAGRVDGTPGKTYDSVKVTLKLGIHGGYEVFKIDADRMGTPGQGDATLAGAEFTLYNRRNGRKVKTITTDAEGHATTGSNGLKWGDYEVKETKAPEGYYLNEEWTDSFDVRENGHMYSDFSHSDEGKIIDEVWRGGIKVIKHDSDNKEQKPQGDGTLEGTEYSIYNISKEDIIVDGNLIGHQGDSSISVNGVNVTYGEANLVMTLITDENGEAATGTDVLPYGTYLVLETKAPTGYLIENDANPSVTGIAEIVTVHTHSEIVTAEKLFDDIIRGGVRFQKVDLERKKYEAQGDAALDGAEIRIYNISEHYVYATEDQETSGFHWVETGEEVTAGNGHVDILHGIEDPRSFEGAELVAVLTTDAEGRAGLGKEALPYGTYIAVETKPSRGYTLNTDWRVIFEIREDGKILDFTDSNNENLLLQQVIRGDVRVFKEDLELAELNGVDRNNYLDGGYKGGEAAHQEGEVNPSQAIGGKAHNALRTAHLNNIEFTITNVSTLSVLSDAGTLQEFQPGEMVTVIKTYYNDEVGAYIAETKDKALPYGTYTIQETKTNNAYLLTDGTPRTFEIETDGEIVTTDKQTHHKSVEGERMIFRNQIKRGEFEFVKIQGYTTERIQSLWVLENATSNEKHVLVTDPNGEYHSAEFDHSDNTNANDFLLDQIGDSYETMINLDAGLADGSITEYHGLWFGLGEDGDMAAVNDELNSLPYGQYTLHEVRTPSNDGMELQNFSFYITRDQKLVHLGTVTDYGITLSTTAKDAGSGTQTGAPSTNTQLIDTVKYNGVMDYGTYVLKTSLVYTDTGEPVLDSKGKEVTKETTVSLTKQSGTIDVTVTFDSTQMAGRSVVFFEELYDMEGNRVSGHTDLLDTNQTVSFAGIQTTLVDTTPAEEESGTVILTDTVKYSGLIVGKTYEMTGTLMNKKTGKELEGADPVTVEFTPETSDGSVDVIFEVPSDLLKGNITVVAFESCTQDGIEIAVHADINDKNQTVEFKEPEIHTTATDQEDGDHYVKPSEHTVITDKVEYSNLTPGKTYKLTGVLMNQANNMPIDGMDPVTVEFTPTSADGYVTVTFELDTTSKLYYKIVVFEYLYLSDVEITAHNDITDKGQTVMVKDKENPKPTPTPTPTPTPKPDGPKIHTMAYSAKDGYDYVGPDESVTIRDIVYYSNLTPGKEYEVRGILHRRHPDGWDMGELLSNGSPVTAYTVFTPQTESGTVELQFTFNASALNGYTAVVFEDLYQNGVLITSHADISDEDQAILISRSPRYRRRRISWVRTGVGSNMIFFGGFGAAAGAALIILLRKRSKLNKK